MKGDHQNESANGNGAQTEQALRASELSYRRLFEAARDGILILDVDAGRISDVNPFLVELLGFPRSEMVGKTVGELSPFKDIVSNQTMLKRLQQDGYVRYDDLPLETRDGRKIAVEFVSNVYQAGDKKVIQCNIRDITRRKQAEQTSIRLAAIVEFSDDAIIGKDLNGIVISWNKGAEKIFGYTASEMVGASILRLIPADRRDEENQILRKIKLGESVEHFETRRQTKDRRLMDVSVTASPIKDANGEVIGVSKVARDITERKRQERELIDKSTELERFTYTVSHDLKGPLVTMKTFLGYLDKDMAGPDPERIKQDIGYMHMAADKMGHLLDELLNLARVGRKMNPSVRVTFQELAREAVGLVAGRISASHAEVQVAEAAVVLEGDRPRLVEIWQNLVDNACKFMGDQPKPRVEIGVEKRGAETVFFVRDNGAGIEPRYREKVFGLFEKLNPKIEGTGMGLALVKRVVELYKGRIWVESGGLGQGANFLFTLPVPVAAGILPAVSGGILPLGTPPHGETRCA